MVSLGGKELKGYRLHAHIVVSSTGEAGAWHVFDCHVLRCCVEHAT